MSETYQVLMEQVKTIAQTLMAAAEASDTKEIQNASHTLDAVLKVLPEPTEAILAREQQGEPQVTVFDRTKDFNNDVRAKMEDLAIVCNGLCIPFYATFCVQNDELRTTYQSFTGSASVGNIYLGNDQIRNHELVQLGYELRPPRPENDSLFLDDDDEDDDEDEYIF